MHIMFKKRRQLLKEVAKSVLDTEIRDTLFKGVSLYEFNFTFPSTASIFHIFKLPVVFFVCCCVGNCLLYLSHTELFQESPLN